MSESQKYAKIDGEGNLVWAPSIYKPETGGVIINPGLETLAGEGYLPVVEVIPAHSANDVLVIYDVQVVEDEDASDTSDSDSSDSDSLGKHIVVTYAVFNGRPAAAFDLVTDNDKEQVYLRNCFFNIGGMTQQVKDVNITKLVSSAGQGSILAFAKKYNDDTSDDGIDESDPDQSDESDVPNEWRPRLFPDLYTLREFQSNTMNYAVPLYVLAGKGGGFLADLRNVPQMQMVEPIL